MKRTIPLMIAAVTGFVVIVSTFIPYAQLWGDRTMIWFDILASVAFVLGGGNLLKMNLQKISNRRPGWGFAAVTVIAFLIGSGFDEDPMFPWASQALDSPDLDRGERGRALYDRAMTYVQTWLVHAGNGVA